MDEKAVVIYFPPIASDMVFGIRKQQMLLEPYFLVHKNYFCAIQDIYL